MDEITPKLSSQISSLSDALDRLEEALNEEKDDFVRDSVIQRFEFSFELLWKLLKNYESFDGREADSPREAFRVGAQLGIIENPELWFEFLKARNLASHTYNEVTSESVYEKAAKFLPAARDLLTKIRSKNQK